MQKKPIGIKQKIFFILIIIMSVVLLFSYGFTYYLFHKTMVASAISSQATMITLNKNLIDRFLGSTNQIVLQLISDEAMGHYLRKTPESALEKIELSRQIRKQFAHYAIYQIANSTYHYRNTLFLSNSIPISNAFETNTLSGNTYDMSCNVYNNKNVEDLFWYQATVQSPNRSYVFINEETQELCFAKYVISTNYANSDLDQGVGVMVNSIALDEVDEALSLTPITKSSAYAILSTDGHLLYTASPKLSESLLQTICTQYQKEPFQGQGNTSKTITLNSQSFLTSINSIDFGMQIIFITPYSDISNYVTYTLRPFVFIVLFAIFLIAVLSYLITDKITRPIIALSTSMSHITDTRSFHLNTLNHQSTKEMSILCESFKKLILRVNQLISDIELQNEKQKKAELQALQAQINPHFIYNAMDIVNWKALAREEDDIANILSSIANLMRYSITDPDSMVCIELELSNVKEFIFIYQLRHPLSLSLKVQSEEDLNSVYIPKFILQPLIENSIRYGTDSLHTKITISITVRVENSTTIIEVMDDGLGCDPALLNDYLHYKEVSLNVTNGFGIRNVNERISLKFGADSGLSYCNDSNHHLTACIHLTANVKPSKKSLPSDGNIPDSHSS